LHARALTLFSGLAASRQSHLDNPSSQIDVYTGIPQEAAALLASKIDQPLTACHLER